MRNLIVDDLNNTSPDQWDAVIDRYADAYHVRFALFDDEGRHLIGPVEDLPREVRTQLPRPHRRATTTTIGDTAPTRALIHTQNPERYWLVVAARVDNPQAGGAMRCTSWSRRPRRAWAD